MKVVMMVKVVMAMVVMAMEGVEGRRRWREVDDTLNRSTHGFKMKTCINIELQHI